VHRAGVQLLLDNGKSICDDLQFRSNIALNRRDPDNIEREGIVVRSKDHIEERRSEARIRLAGVQRLRLD